MDVYRREPSIMLIMKEEKMYPRGRGVVGYVLETSWREGTQRKTLR
jgi:hypothetical protein